MPLNQTKPNKIKDSHNLWTSRFDDPIGDKLTVVKLHSLCIYVILTYICLCLCLCLSLSLTPYISIFLSACVCVYVCVPACVIYVY